MRVLLAVFVLLSARPALAQIPTPDAVLPVAQSASATSVGTSANPTVFGQVVTFTATVVPVGGGGMPTGQVAFTIDGGSPLTVTLSAAGTASFATSILTVAGSPHSVSAAYIGDSNFLGSSGSLSGGQTVQKASTATTVLSSPGSTVFGQTVAFTATVSAVAPGSGVPTGQVVFTIDGFAQAPSTLASGTATFTTSILSVAGSPHSVAAAYGGSANFLTSSGSLAGGHTVNKASTTTTLGSSINPSTVGQTVTFTATVTVNPPGAGMPSGSVAFTIDGVAAGTAGLSGGSGFLATSTLNQGSHPVTAGYPGTANFNTSASAVVTQVVNLLPPPSFAANATGQSQVALGWGAVTGATGYEVFRSSQNGPFGLVSSPTGTSTSDSGLSPDTTYLYKVRAVGPAGPSNFSAVDAATTIVFTNSDLTGVAIKAVHMAELRTAVNAMRVAAGLLPASFPDPTLVPGETTVQAAHVTQLRTALDAARASIGLPPIVYVEPAIGPNDVTVKTVHMLQLRVGVQ